MRCGGRLVREKPGFRTEWSAEGFVIAGSTRNPLRRGIPDQVRDDVVQHGGDGSGMTLFSMAVMGPG